MELYGAYTECEAVYGVEHLLALAHVWRSPDLSDYVVAAKGAPEAMLQLCARDDPARSEAARLITERAGGDLEMVFFTNGGAEIFDMAGRGRIDAFFLSGGQIDGQANINLIGTCNVIRLVAAAMTTQAAAADGERGRWKIAATRQQTRRWKIRLRRQAEQLRCSEAGPAEGQGHEPSHRPEAATPRA